MMAWIYLLGVAVAGQPTLDFPHAPDPDRMHCPVISSQIVMAGDVMLHGPQLRSAHQPDGSYRFDEVFSPVAPFIHAADLAIANLETVTAGEEAEGYSSWPRFNSPESLVDALAGAGFHLLQTANNHSLDRGEQGLLRTLDAVDRRGLGRAGTFRSLEERSQPWVTAVLPGPVRVAFLATTFSTNMIPLPRGRPWMVSMLSDGTIEADIAAARQEADLVIVGAHWGEEYRFVPEPETVAWARRLVDAGADVVMGTHPHVLQPAAVLTAQDDWGEPRDALVLYSLGNFVSNQRIGYRDGGALARLTVSRCRGGGKTWISEVSFLPVWVDRTLAGGARAYRVVPTPPWGAPCEDLDLSEADCGKMSRFRDHAAEVLGRGNLSWEPRQAQVPVLGFDWESRGLPGFSWGGPRGAEATGVLATRGEEER